MISEKESINNRLVMSKLRLSKTMICNACNKKDKPWRECYNKDYVCIPLETEYLRIISELEAISKYGTSTPEFRHPTFQWRPRELESIISQLKREANIL